MRYSPDVYQAKAQYYVIARRFVETFVFAKRVYKCIFELHALGYSLRKISRLFDTTVCSVHKVVLTHKKIMMNREKLSDSKKDLIVIRPMDEGDLNFIALTWLRGLYGGNDWFKAIPHPLFAAYYRQVIDAILARPNVFVNVACLKEDRDVILSYAVMERKPDKMILHWVYTKSAWRKLGIASDILPKIDEVTHLTKIGRAIMKKNWIFNPFL